MRDTRGEFTDDFGTRYSQLNDTYYYQPTPQWVFNKGLALSSNGSMSVASPFVNHNIFHRRPDVYSNFDSLTTQPVSMYITRGQTPAIPPRIPDPGTPPSYYTDFHFVIKPWNIFKSLSSTWNEFPIGTRFMFGLDLETFLGWVPNTKFEWRVASLNIECFTETTGIDIIDERQAENMYQDGGYYVQGRGSQTKPLDSVFHTLFQAMIPMCKEAEPTYSSAMDWGVRLSVRCFYLTIQASVATGKSYNFDLDYAWNFAPLDPLDFNVARRLLPTLAPATFKFCDDELDDQSSTSSSIVIV